MFLLQVLDAILNKSKSECCGVQKPLGMSSPHRSSPTPLPPPLTGNNLLQKNMKGGPPHFRGFLCVKCIQLNIFSFSFKFLTWIGKTPQKLRHRLGFFWGLEWVEILHEIFFFKFCKNVQLLCSAYFCYERICLFFGKR